MPLLREDIDRFSVRAMIIKIILIWLIGRVDVIAII